jgi:hypothetical protein
MVRKIFLIILALVLVVGCAPGIKPGETKNITLYPPTFYFGVLPVYDYQGMTEQEQIDYINDIVVASGANYMVLPEDVKAALLADTAWITPAGVTVEDPIVTLEQKKMSCRGINENNDETLFTVQGYDLKISATVIAAPGAESGKVILKMAQFKTLESLGVYAVDPHCSMTVPGRSSVIENSDTYIVANVK